MNNESIPYPKYIYSQICKIFLHFQMGNHPSRRFEGLCEDLMFHAVISLRDPQTPASKNQDKAIVYQKEIWPWRRWAATPHNRDNTRSLTTNSYFKKFAIQLYSKDLSFLRDFDFKAIIEFYHLLFGLRVSIDNNPRRTQDNALLN